MSDAPAKRPKWLTLVLVLAPVWLAASAAVAVWLSIHKEEAEAEADQRRFTQSMSVERIEDDLSKFTRIIGERHPGNATAAANLTRTASMIEGVLGPANTGYRIDLIPGPQAWPIIRAILPGRDREAPARWILAGYDSAPESTGGALNASGVAAAIAVAQAMARDNPHAGIHFIFIPHAYAPASPVAETIRILRERMDKPSAVFALEAMGAKSDHLIIDGTDLPELRSLAELGKTPPTGDDTRTLVGQLIDAGLPAVRVSTRTRVPESATPSATDVAAASGRLVEWIHRCDNLDASR